MIEDIALGRMGALIIFIARFLKIRIMSTATLSSRYSLGQGGKLLRVWLIPALIVVGIVLVWHNEAQKCKQRQNMHSVGCSIVNAAGSVMSGMGKMFQTLAKALGSFFSYVVLYLLFSVAVRVLKGLRYMFGNKKDGTKSALEKLQTQLENMDAPDVALKDMSAAIDELKEGGFMNKEFEALRVVQSLAKKSAVQSTILLRRLRTQRDYLATLRTQSRAVIQKRYEDALGLIRGERDAIMAQVSERGYSVRDWETLSNEERKVLREKGQLEDGTIVLKIRANDMEVFAPPMVTQQLFGEPAPKPNVAVRFFNFLTDTIMGADPVGARYTRAQLSAKFPDIVQPQYVHTRQELELRYKESMSNLDRNISAMNEVLDAATKNVGQGAKNVRVSSKVFETKLSHAVATVSKEGAKVMKAGGVMGQALEVMAEVATDIAAGKMPGVSSSRDPKPVRDFYSAFDSARANGEDSLARVRDAADVIEKEYEEQMEEDHDAELERIENNEEDVV